MSGLFSRAGGDPDAMAQPMNSVGLDLSGAAGSARAAPGEAAPGLGTLLQRAGPLLAPDGDTTTDAPAKSFLGSAADMLEKAGKQQGDLADAQGRVAAAYAGAERAAAQTAASAGPVMPTAPAQSLPLARTGGGLLEVMAGQAHAGQLAAFAFMRGRR